jgi:hypothetical protein
MTASVPWPDERVQIPDLLRAAPGLRRILDRYGLRGCGGPEGPVESLGFFARAHDVPVERLLRELRADLEQAKASRQAAHADEASSLGDTIYRPFFKAGIAVVLTLGAVWGAYLLLRIGLRRDFTAAGLHEVNAHGHAMIFGWVGLFVMGFAYQAFPRFKHTSLAYPGLAHASLWLMLAGLVIRSVGEPLVAYASWMWWPTVEASMVEVIAIVLFAWVIGATWRASGKPLAFYDYYIACALGWFWVQAVYETFYLAATLSAGPEHVLSLVATWQAPLRDIQIHGFALLMILGVSQRLFHHFYGLPQPSGRKSLAALMVLNVAVLGEVAGLILMREVGHGWAALWYASVLLLMGGVAVLVGGWHIFWVPRETDRSLKFLRAAYVWLFVSLAMLALLPLYLYGFLSALAPASEAVQIGFSHAYYGATRHAITVGFISLMIVGVAAKVVPTLNGVDVRGLTRLWVPFLLINGGCALRVIGQTLTDFTAVSFPFTGASGLLEVLGLAVWGAHLWSIMAGRVWPRAGIAPASPARVWLLPGQKLVAQHQVRDVLQVYPQLLDAFVAIGFRPLSNPVLRRTLTRYITIEQACRVLGVDSQETLDALNRELDRLATGKYSLPLVSTGQA